jgi:hypothetical protein
MNGFIDHLHTRLENKSNYSVTANLHNSQITTVSAKPLPASCVFTLSLATVYNSGDSSVSPSQVLSSQTPLHNSTELCPLLITPWHAPHRKHSSSIVACVYIL